MQNSTTVNASDPAVGIVSTLQASGAEAPESECFHCGAPLRGAVFTSRHEFFCCQGCLTVFELLTENGLGEFYRFGKAAGVRAKAMPKEEEFALPG